MLILFRFFLLYCLMFLFECYLVLLLECSICCPLANLLIFLPNLVQCGGSLVLIRLRVFQFLETNARSTCFLHFLNISRCKMFLVQVLNFEIVLNYRPRENLQVCFLVVGNLNLPSLWWCIWSLFQPFWR